MISVLKAFLTWAYFRDNSYAPEAIPNAWEAIPILPVSYTHLDVYKRQIQYRLEHEYGAKCNYEPLSIHKACWIEADEKSDEFKEFARLKQRFMAKDKYGQPVFLADSSFTIHMTQEKFPNVKLHFISEFKQE